MTTGDRIKARRIECGLSVSELADKLGKNRATVYRYESNDIETMPANIIRPLADALDTTPGYLMGWTDDPYDYDLDPDARFSDIPADWIRRWRDAGLTPKEMWDSYLAVENDSRPDDDLPPNIIPLPKMKKVPLIGSIACGEPILAEENIEGFLTMPGDVGADFCLRCKGDSMINVRIFDGDIVYIRQQPQVEDGEIAAVMVGDDEATLKRVRLFPDHIILEPENPQYRAKSFWDADMAQVRVLGKAVAFVGTIS